MSRKDTTLYAFWSKKEKDIMYCYPGSKSDGHLLNKFFSPSFGGGADLIDELERRGYDPTTFRFSIKKKGATASKAVTPEDK